MANILEANSIFFILITMGINLLFIALIFGICEWIHYCVSKKFEKQPINERSSITSKLMLNYDSKTKYISDSNESIFRQFKKLFHLKPSEIKCRCTNDEQLYLLFIRYYFYLFSIRILIISLYTWLPCTTPYLSDRENHISLL